MNQAFKRGRGKGVTTKTTQPTTPPPPVHAEKGNRRTLQCITQVKYAKIFKTTGLPVTSEAVLRHPGTHS